MKDNHVLPGEFQRGTQRMKIRIERLVAVLLAVVFVASGMSIDEADIKTVYAAEVTDEEVETTTAAIEEALTEQVSESTDAETIDNSEEADTEAADNAEETATESEIDYSRIELTGDEVFEDNIQVAGVSVSGLTYDEAQTVIESELDGRLANEIKIKISDDEYIYTFNDMGVSFPEQKVGDILKESIVYGNHGTLITVYKEKATIDNEGKEFDVDFVLDESVINRTITELAESYTEQLPQNAEIHRINGEFVLTESVNGVGVNVAETIKEVTDNIKTWVRGNIQVSADVEETYPDITSDELSVIKDLLGSCETSFVGNDAAGRVTNLKNGTSKIDDIVLMPGETLSVHDKLTPFTVANGYKTATAYADGAYVDSIGGGICQISTTLYNAALEAEIEVVKRSNHSMTVGYVDYAFDAAVNDNGSKDLVIRNNYDYPIYIESYLYNMQVCVYIYGLETRDPNRVVEYYNKVIEEVFPTEEEYQYIEVTPEHPQYSPENGFLEEELVGPDEILQIQGNYPLCRAKLYKRVTVNGVVVEDTCLHTDKYRSSPAKFLVGVNYIYPGKVVESTEASTEGGTGTSTEGGTAASTENTTNLTTQAGEQPTEAATQSQSESPTGAPSSEPSGE